MLKQQEVLSNTTTFRQPVRGQLVLPPYLQLKLGKNALSACLISCLNISRNSTQDVIWSKIMEDVFSIVLSRQEQVLTCTSSILQRNRWPGICLSFLIFQPPHPVLSTTFLFFSAIPLSPVGNSRSCYREAFIALSFKGLYMTLFITYQYSE